MSRDQVLVGIPEEEGRRSDDPETNAAIGYVNEYGSPADNIPPRPFLLPGVEEAAPQVANALGRAVDQAFDSQTAIDRGLNEAGLLAQSSVKNRIVAQTGFAPLAARTLAARRSAGFAGTKALIRTSQLINSITYVVRSR
ncbi:MAG: hypothetical protein ACREVA_00155 [Burkholderiales bacterium]